MSDIRAGDVVVCVDAKPRGLSCHEDSLCRLRERTAYRVMQAYRDPSGISALLIEGARSSHPRGGWKADRFRKIDKADDGFCTWMQTVREERTPYRVPASVDGSPEGQDAEGGLIGEADDSAVPAKQGDAQTPSKDHS